MFSGQEKYIFTIDGKFLRLKNVCLNYFLNIHKILSFFITVHKYETNFLLIRKTGRYKWTCLSLTLICAAGGVYDFRNFKQV
jgi:hypothetical protein